MAQRIKHLREASRQEGFALIVVIWIGILLSLMAAAFSSSVRSRIRATASHAETIRAEALADAGVRIALVELLNRSKEASTPPRFLTDGTPVMCAIGAEAVLVIRVEDEEGKVNLNTSNEELLTALFSGLGANHDKARGYADLIMDFRDSDDDKRPGGAERNDYTKMPGGGLGPKNANFASVNELDQVPGLPSDLRERAKPFLSVFSTKDGIDAGVASRSIRDLLVKGSNGIVDASNTSGSGDGALSIVSELPRSFQAASSHRAYAMIAEAVLTSGARYVSEAVVALPNSEVGIPVFQHWRRGTSRALTASPLTTPQHLAPC